MLIEESKAGRAVGVVVILNKKGEFVAKVLSLRTPHGAVHVNVWQTNAAAERCAVAYEKATGATLPRDEYGRTKFHNTQQRSAGGYGYDKFTSALSGMWIDGHPMTNHCERDGAPKYPRGRKSYPSDAKPKPGYSFANYASGPCPSSPYRDLPEGESGWIDCYRREGLAYLGAIGYRDIRGL